jgi:hypothetical protein
MEPVFSRLPTPQKISTIGQVSGKLRKFLFTSYDAEEKSFRQPEILLSFIKALADERELPISIVHPNFFLLGI